MIEIGILVSTSFSILEIIVQGCKMFTRLLHVNMNKVFILDLCLLRFGCEKVLNPQQKNPIRLPLSSHLSIDVTDIGRTNTLMSTAGLARNYRITQS